MPTPDFTAFPIPTILLDPSLFDPLFLTKGFSLTAVNPVVSGNSADRWGGSFRVITDCTQTDPQFAANAALSNSLYVRHGQNVNSALTIAKQSYFTINNYQECNAAGQKFVQQNKLLSYGMGDSAIFANNFVVYAGGPVNGDEGMGWGLFSELVQQRNLNINTITFKPATSTINTTTTQAIAKSKSPQTVNVVSTAGSGLTVGDWVIIEQELQVGAAQLEAVQVTGFTATSISGVFRYNHNSGVTVTPALRLVLDFTGTLGQDRVLINRSPTPYTTGTVIAPIVGGTFAGSGTGWSIGMVGGNAKNIGSISLAADDYSSYPFNGTGQNGTLKSWYQITSVADATHLGIFTYSVAGDGAYRGQGPGAGTYAIRPSARVLRIVTDANGNYTNEVICETSTHTWNVLDTVEQVISPYADVNGFAYTMSAWTNGGTYRHFMHVVNGGARKFQSAFHIGDQATIHGAGADGVAFENGFQIGESVNYGLDLNFCNYAAIRLYSPGSGGGAGITDKSGRISWGDNGAGIATGWIGPQSGNGGLQINALVGTDGVTPASSSLAGYLNFVMPSKGTNTDATLWQMNWGGWLFLPYLGGGVRPRVGLDNNSGANAETGFLRWVADTFEIAVDKVGSGAYRDMTIKTGNVEQLRFVAGQKLRFGTPNFSANGSVATALTSLGPSGASTTVQKWLTILDDTGATRYIPCF